MTGTLYEKLGGEESISKVVDYFYGLVLKDNTVNHYFKETDMDKQRKHQTKFISFGKGTHGNEFTRKSFPSHCQSFT